MENDSEVKIIEIHKGAKYFIVPDHILSVSERALIEKRLRDWWESDFPFMLMNGGSIKLVRVDDREITNGIL